jgi:hypothetical protein
MKGMSLLLLALALLVAAVPVAYAQTGNLAHLLYNTGVDSSKNVLPDGTPDPHYTLYSVPAGSPGTAVKMIANPAWVPTSSSSAWIGPWTSGLITAHPGTYKYRYQLDLSGYDPSTVVIHGRWTTDNEGEMFVNISLNNTPVTTTPQTGYSQWWAFLLNSGFVAGVNTLEFHVVNEVLGDPGTETQNPTGLRVEFLEGNATPVIPEPAFFQLGALAGMSALGLLRLRRKG